MQVLRAANYKVMPWKNGMGSTTEIAISPEHNRLDDFDWRVSMAQVSNDGAFSSFPGIDRTLLILEGEGIALNVGDRTLHIDRQSAHSFPGDQPTSATLPHGPIVDLNIMSRRGRRPACREAHQGFVTTGVFGFAIYTAICRARRDHSPIRCTYRNTG